MRQYLWKEQQQQQQQHRKWEEDFVVSFVALLTYLIAPLSSKASAVKQCKPLLSFSHSQSQGMEERICASLKTIHVDCPRSGFVDITVPEIAELQNFLSSAFVSELRTIGYFQGFNFVAKFIQGGMSFVEGKLSYWERN